MLRPGDVARPAPARTFTTELSWVGSPRIPTSVMTGWLIVIYHRRTFTGWTGSLMGCEQRTQRTQRHCVKMLVMHPAGIYRNTQYAILRFVTVLRPSRRMGLA